MKILKIAQYIVFLSIAFFLVYWSVKDVDLNYLFSIIIKANLSVVFVTIIILILSHWVRALRWNLLIQTIGYQPKNINAFYSLMLGYIANMLLPRLGEIVRCTSLSKKENLAIDKIIGTVLLERMVDMLCLILVSGIVFVFQIDLIGSYFTSTLLPKIKDHNPIYAIGVILVLIVIVFIVIKIAKKNEKISILFLKIKTFMQGIFKGMKTIFHLQKKGRFLLYTFLIWFLYALGFWYGFRAITQTEHLNFMAALTCLFTGSIGMIATQGGIGAYPLLVSQALTWYGVEVIYGRGMGWLNWFIQTFVIFLLGIPSVIKLTFSKKINEPTI